MKNKHQIKKYKYPDCKDIFELEKIEGFIYKFKCGHWVTDNVFLDLIDLKTNTPNWELNKLFN